MNGKGSDRSGTLAGAILFLGVLLAYLPVRHAGFVWDDDILITANPTIVGPLGLREIWTTAAASTDISPLTRTTFWLEHALWGLASGPYHMVNVLMHAACAVTLWRVLRRLNVPGAWIGAGLWGLHPVEVESVAWVAELKNTESGLFYLLAVLFFTRWIEIAPPGECRRLNSDYRLSVLFAALALACKSSTVILPVVLCLAAWWKEGRWRWRNVMAVAPMVLMSGAATLLSMQTQKEQVGEIIDLHWVRTWPERLATAGDAVWFYLGKLVWPHPLMAIYPRWQIDAGAWTSYLPLAAVFAALAILWLARASVGRCWFFVFAYFVVALLPVLGLVENTIFRFSLVFDHFQYLASMGPLALAGAGMARLANLCLPAKPRLQWIPGAGLMLILGVVSSQRSSVYQSQDTLWTDAIAKNPACWLGYLDLGAARLQGGDLDAAISHFRQAIALNPRYAEAYNDLGEVLVKKGRTDEGLADFRQAIEIIPLFGPPHDNIGNIDLLKGQADAAISEYQTALRINPNDVTAHTSLGGVLLQKGEADRAAAEFQAVMVLDPTNSRAHYSLGLIFDQKGNPAQAVAEYQAAFASDPQNALAAAKLGDDLAQAGQMAGAIACYQKALEINPGDGATRGSLAVALFKTGELNAALDQFKKILAANANDATAHNGLGIVLAQKGEIVQAVAEFQEALRLKPDFTGAKNNLARAQAIVRQGATSPP